MTEPSPLRIRVLALSRHPINGYLVLLALTTLMFYDVLLQGQNIVLGNHTTDVFSQFLAWRQFGFGELSQGHLALWNPHVFAGAPYFGGFQSALLYPPNWLFLVLPTPVAINWSIALHVFLAGAFMNAWAVRRGLHPVAACLSGALLMFCGAYFLHIYAGHLTNLCAMVWAPLIFLAIDELFDCADVDAFNMKHIIGWILLGAMSLNLQILAGHPQYVFYTGIAAMAYSALRVPRTRHKALLLLALFAVVAGGVALAAIQLSVGITAASETVRAKALPYEFASVFSLPFENLLTLFTPGLFGGMAPHQYFGRWYLWEMSAFIGVTGCILAAYGAARGTPATTSHHRPMAWVVVILFIIATGVNTPLFHFLYSYFPGFDRFRGVSKFIFPASMLLVMLAGIGFNRLLATRHAESGLVKGAMIGGGVLMVLALAASQINWIPVLQITAETGEAYLLSKLSDDPSAIQKFAVMAPAAQAHFVKSVLVAGAIAFLVGGLLLAMRRKPSIVWLVGALAVLEVFTFAAASREASDVKDFYATSSQNFLDQHPGDYRIANTLNPNSAMVDGVSDMAGNDPGVVSRYAELMFYIQGKDPDKAIQFLDFSRPDRLYEMLRLRFLIQLVGNDQVAVTPFENAMPQFSLIGNFRVVSDRDAIFEAMRNPSFDFRREVILEKKPIPLPTETPQGVIRKLESTTDSQIVEIDLEKPAILLMTDLYTPSWRAVALPGSSQAQYELLPANYVLRAIPLDAGHHKLKIEYHPKGLWLGTLISILSLLAWFGAAAWVLVSQRRMSAAT